MIQVVYSLNWYDFPVFMKKKIIFVNYLHPQLIFQSSILIYHLEFYGGMAFYSWFKTQFYLIHIFRRELEKINQWQVVKNWVKNETFLKPFI